MKEKTFREPELRHYNFDLSRRWFIIFYAYDPNKGETTRVRLFHPINKFKTVHERLQVANHMMEVIRKDLRAGKTLTSTNANETGNAIGSIPKMSVSEAIEFVRQQKEFTNHRQTYTEDFNKVRRNWERFLLFKNRIDKISKVKHIEQDKSRVFIPGEISKTKFDEYVGIPVRFAEILQESGVLNSPVDYFIFGETGRPDKAPRSKRHFYERNDAVLKELKLKAINKGYTLYSYKHSGAISLYTATKDIALVQRQ